MSEAESGRNPTRLLNTRTGKAARMSHSTLEYLQNHVQIKACPGWSGYYVDNFGQVYSGWIRVGIKGKSGLWSKESGDHLRKLKPLVHKDGRLFVSITKSKGMKKVTKPIHRLVLEAFIGPCPLSMECCHGDGNPSNNRLDNLRWDTRSSNEFDKIRHGTKCRGERHHNSKLTEDDVRSIRRLRESGNELSSIAEKFGITLQAVWYIWNRKNWGWLE